MSYDDDLNEDEFGALSQARLQRLLERRAKLVAKMPLLDGGKKRIAAGRIQRIDRILARKGITAQQLDAAAAMAASGVDGVGGLMFQAEAPPGIGRLLRLPFYPTEATNGVVTSGGNGVASTTIPTWLEVPTNIAATQVSGIAHTLTTPQISWATLRLVGFETTVSAFRGISNPGPKMAVRSLLIGGGATLFTHEQFASADIYSWDQPEFCGLRDYPIIRSPNFASVQTVALGTVAGETQTVSYNLICEVLVDDNYGAHIPGPYARPGAMVRQGGNFI